MYAVIGQIKDNSKLEACRIVDTETKEVKDISLKKIRKAVKNGVRVIGFRRDFIGTEAQFQLARLKSKFTWEKIPELNGKGELINPEDEKLMLVIGWHGFAEVKQYHLLNYKGEEIVLNREEFIHKVKNGEINGADFSLYNGDLYLIRDLDIERD